MKSFAGILFALLLGVAIAFIRPAQPVQMETPGADYVISSDGLDNDAILEDGNIHPARKCKSLRFFPEFISRASHF